MDKRNRTSYVKETDKRGLNESLRGVAKTNLSQSLRYARLALAVRNEIEPRRQQQVFVSGQRSVGAE
jgi:hypothetical protein